VLLTVEDDERVKRWKGPVLDGSGVIGIEF